MRKIILIIINIFFISFIFGAEDISNGYKEIKLGMSKEVVKNILKNSRDFNMKKE